MTKDDVINILLQGGQKGADNEVIMFLLAKVNGVNYMAQQQAGLNRALSARDDDISHAQEVNSKSRLKRIAVQSGGELDDAQTLDEWVLTSDGPTTHGSGKVESVVESQLPNRPTLDAERLRVIRAAIMRSKLFAMFTEQAFWHAHHVDLVWRYNGEDRREEADWLKDVWYALLPIVEVEEDVGETLSYVEGGQLVRMEPPIGEADATESEELCPHGNGMTDYCEPCGRIHGDG